MARKLKQDETLITVILPEYEVKNLNLFILMSHSITTETQMQYNLFTLTPTDQCTKKPQLKHLYIIIPENRTASYQLKPKSH